jgi:hypothetical protein
MCCCGNVHDLFNDDLVNSHLRRSATPQTAPEDGAIGCGKLVSCPMQCGLHLLAQAPALVEYQGWIQQLLKHCFLNLGTCHLGVAIEAGRSCAGTRSSVDHKI